LQYEIYREYVHGREIFLIEAVEVHPRKFLILGQVIVQATQEAPETGQQMRCEEHKEEQSHQIHIVPHLHYVIPAANKELIHNLPEELE